MNKLADKKIVLCIILMLLLCASILVFHTVDSRRLCNVRIKSEERLLQICSDKTFIEYADNAKELILFESQPVPYDGASNSFYICQDMEGKEYRGTVTAAAENISIWIAEDEYIHEFEKALSQSHSFSIWIATQDSYTICKIVFTGLPVVTLHTEERPGMQYIQGSIDVWDPADEEIGTVSLKKSDVQIKCSQSMETYTVKLMGKKGTVHRKLSFLDMGKYDAWKLYKVNKQDMTCIRSMLAYLLWNRVNSVERLDRPCRYAEVIINGEYRGLYLLAPRVDDDFLEIGEDGKVISIKQNMGVLGDNENPDTATLCINNAAEYFLFLEITYAFENVSDDFYIAWDNDESQSFLLPGKIEYCFGIFPNRLQYMTWQAAERILAPEDTGIAALEGLAGRKDVERQMGQRFQELRGHDIANDALLKLVEELQQYLWESGYIARSGISKDDGDYYGEKIGELVRYLIERMEVLDRYYGAEG